MISGILNVYKERGMTSFDVIRAIRRITGERKAGHTGTLDPDAEGVLPVCLGKATKVCGLITDTDKTYRAVMELGAKTDTQDASGTVLCTAPVACTPEEAAAALQSFVGAYDQLTPMYSARRVGGKRLYELARAGIEVERKTHRVQILEIRIEEINLPRVTFTVRCSRGTYIRTLCSDAGDRLGCGAFMASLVRTACGRFAIEDSVRLAMLQEAADRGELESLLIGADALFEGYPAFKVRPEAGKILRSGGHLAPSVLTAADKKPAGARDAGRIRVYDEQGRFAALYRYDAGRGVYLPDTMFL